MTAAPATTGSSGGAKVDLSRSLLRGVCDQADLLGACLDSATGPHSTVKPFVGK